MKADTIITRALANGPMTCGQICDGRDGQKSSIRSALARLVKAGTIVKEPGNSPRKSLYALAAGDPAPTRRKKRKAGKADLLVPKDARLAADAFVAAITAGKEILLLRGEERIRLTPDQSIEVADLVFANFEPA